MSVFGNAVAMIAGAVIFGLTLLCFSLRDFSRSRLEDVCRTHGKQDRFGRILQSYEKCLLLSELLLLLLITTAVWRGAGTTYFQNLSYPSTGNWQAIVSWTLQSFSVMLAIGFVFVVLPWTLSRVTGEAFLYRTWPFVNLGCRLASPVWQASIRLDRIVHRVFGVPEPDSDTAANLLTEELLTVVEESRREGVIQSNASTMIHRVVGLQTEDVAAIMTPRTDIVTISAIITLREALPEMIENGFSRVPVIRDGIDDIVGILYARDLLSHVAEVDTGMVTCVGDIARDVLYAPESQGIGDLLEAMRQQKVHMAIVVDEYSGVSGLVTLEDILEEIVGDISDEYDQKDESLWRHHTEGRTEVDARFHLDDLNEEFGYSFPEDEEFDTIGGFMMSCFGRIPVAGDEHFWNDLKLTVLEADERRIVKVRIEGKAKTSTRATSSV
jgi:putative hemolysin